MFPALLRQESVMNGLEDLPLVMLQKAQHAAEAAAASTKLLESEAGHRLTSIEARLVGVEGRLSVLSAGQIDRTLTLRQIADTQLEHTARFDGIDKRFDGIEQALANILAKLP
jgi:hypothetical protein